jgi:hypothetical protein
MATEFDPDRVFSRPLMVTLATRCAEGPRTAPMWFIWEDGALWMPSDASSSSALRLDADPSAAAEIVDFDADSGVLLHLGLRGPATVGAMEVDRFKRLLARYLGPDPAAWNPWFIDKIARFDDPAGRMIRLQPDTIFTNNVSFFRTGPELAWP